MKKNTYIIYVIFILLNFPAIGSRNFYYFPLSLRRVKEATPLRALIQPKLELAEIALTKQGLSPSKKRFKDNPAELNALADRLSEPKVKDSLGLIDTQIARLQEILCNYQQYSSSQIEKETGFSKLAFPPLLHAWIEQGPFYEGKISLVFGGHNNEADYERLRTIWERQISEAKAQGFDVVFIVEAPLPGLDKVITAARQLGVSPYEIARGSRYDAILQKLLRENEEAVGGIFEHTQDGVLPPKEALERLPGFFRKLLLFLTGQKIPVLCEKVSVSAFKKYLLSEEYAEKSYAALLKGDIESYLREEWQRIVHSANSFKLRDEAFQNQIEQQGRPSRHILGFRGALHQIQAGDREGFGIETVNPFACKLDPASRLMQRRIKGEAITDTEIREGLLRQFVYTIPMTILKLLHPELESGRVIEICEMIAGLWSEEKIRELAEHFAKGGREEGSVYFYNWLRNSALSEEIKDLFRP